MDSIDLPSLIKEQQNLYRLQELVDYHVKRVAKGDSFLLSENLIKDLHRVAMHELPASPGEYRQNEVAINGALHRPPNWYEVTGLMSNLCSYINGSWKSRDLIHLAAFSMWQVNFIHPFRNGNGRVSRAVAYLVMCAKFGKLLPAENSVVKQIVDNRKPYYDALACADACARSGRAFHECTEELELLLTDMLKQQLKDSLSVIR
jgi:Fic family protein